MSSRDKSKHDRKTRDRSGRESPTYSYSNDGSFGSAPAGSSYPQHNHPTTNIIQRDLDDMHVSDQIKFYEGRSLDAVEHCRKTGSLLILVIGDDSKANITLTEFDEVRAIFLESMKHEPHDYFYVLLTLLTGSSQNLSRYLKIRRHVFIIYNYLICLFFHR